MTDNVYKWLCGILSTQPSQAKWNQRYSGEPYRAVLAGVADYFVVAGARLCWKRGSWRPSPQELFHAAHNVASGGQLNTSPQHVTQAIQYYSTICAGRADSIMRSLQDSVDKKISPLVPIAIEMGGDVATLWPLIIESFCESQDLREHDPKNHAPIDQSVTAVLGGIA